MNRRNLARATVAALSGACLVVAAACGGDDDSAMGGSDASAPEVTTSPTLDAAGDTTKDAGVDAADAADAADARLACLSSTKPVFLAALDDPSSRLESNDTYLYQVGGGGVKRVPKSGGPVETIAQSALAALKVTNAHACWGVFEAGTTCALADGSSPVSIIPSSYPGDLWLTGTTVHYVRHNDGFVGRVQIDGGGNVVLVDTPSPLAPRVSAVPLGPWVLYGEGAEVRAVPNAGPDASIAVHTAGGSEVVYELVTDGTEVYWSGRGGAPAIWRTNGGVGGTPVVVMPVPIGGNLGHAYGHAVDATHVYAAFRDALGHALIARAPKNAVNATATPLVEDIVEALGMVVDDSCIYYWAEQTADAGAKKGLWALRKPAP